MATRRVLRMGNPLLRQKAEPIPLEEITSDDIKNLLKDMNETMNVNKGIGIAAPQIGVSKQVAIVGIPKGSDRYRYAKEFDLVTVINPVVTVLDETKQGYWEGCLSVPKLRGFVERPRKVRVEYYDIEAKKHSVEVEDFIATVFQHEIDHLHGIIYVDRVPPTKLSYVDEYIKYIQPLEKKEQEDKENS